MDKDQFNNLLINFTCLSEEEAQQLIDLSVTFPYSQVIRSMAARAAQDNGTELREKLLHKSAVYCTDRSALKTVMTSPKKNRVEPSVPQLETMVSEPSSEEATEKFHLQVLQDIANLRESKRLYELTIERMENEKLLPVATLKKEEVKMEVAAQGGEALIEEIKSTKKKIKPEGAKQKEQIEIIEQFIKKQPTIARPKADSKPAVDHDLSEPSGHFGEHIVSETLVEILVKQGKKEKAIEALKKLIWKFPQKKAYFAAQIEDLRK